MLVLEAADEHQELLAEGMGMGCKGGAGGIADDAGRTGGLATDAVEHAPLDAGQRRGLPWQAGPVDHLAPREIGPQPHGRGHSSSTSSGLIDIITTRLPSSVTLPLRRLSPVSLYSN